MGVTFLIGNGFDLNLGMKTRYTDMYDSYIKSESKSTVIENFKKDLQKEEHNHYANWSDFEMGMANYARNYTNENDFIECIRDFKAHMVKWLSMQQTPVLENLWLKVDDNSFTDSIVGFYGGLIPNDRYEIENVLSKEKINVCNFISFNYTSVLDEILNEISDIYESNIDNISFKINDGVVHIHGDLDNDVVLGVDNITQLKVRFRFSEKTRQAFIKPEFNDRFDFRRVKKAIDLIATSSVICVYGLSLGESDQMWIDVLKEWLLASESNHLVYYFFETNVIPAYNFDMRMDREAELKDSLAQKMDFTKEETQKVLNRIHIPISCNLFDFYQKEDSLITA